MNNYILNVKNVPINSQFTVGAGATVYEEFIMRTSGWLQGIMFFPMDALPDAQTIKIRIKNETLNKFWNIEPMSLSRIGLVNSVVQPKYFWLQSQHKYVIELSNSDVAPHTFGFYINYFPYNDKLDKDLIKYNPMYIKTESSIPNTGIKEFTIKLDSNGLLAFLAVCSVDLSGFQNLKFNLKHSDGSYLFALDVLENTMFFNNYSGFINSGFWKLDQNQSELTFIVKNNTGGVYDYKNILIFAVDGQK